MTTMEFPIEHLSVPEPLLHIPQPPKSLKIRGTFPDINSYTFLTVVGPRNYTSYGSDVCRTLISGLAGYPIVIVSGLAHGIDTIVHETALDNNMITIAFPGSGLDNNAIYPRTNYQLAIRILESGGALISEFNDNEGGMSWMFPTRNRLMAGISKATLIIEAEHKSGTRITAKLATDYNRDVLAVPGNIFSKKSEGTNELIRMGATQITSLNDILVSLEITMTETAPMDLFSQCSPEEESILKHLSSPQQRGELIRKVQLPTHKVNILLSQMEMKGLVKEVNGEVRRV